MTSATSLTQLPQMQRLLAIMARLRDPERGCDWDRAQDFRSEEHTSELQSH